MGHPNIFISVSYLSCHNPDAKILAYGPRICFNDVQQNFIITKTQSSQLKRSRDSIGPHALSLVYLIT